MTLQVKLYLRDSELLNCSQIQDTRWESRPDLHLDSRATLSYHRFLSSALLPLREPPMPMPMPSSFKAGDHNTGSTPKWATPDYCSPQTSALLQNQKNIALMQRRKIYQPKKWHSRNSVQSRIVLYALVGSEQADEMGRPRFGSSMVFLRPPNCGTSYLFFFIFVIIIFDLLSKLYITPSHYHYKHHQRFIIVVHHGTLFLCYLGGNQQKGPIHRTDSISGKYLNICIKKF